MEKNIKSLIFDNMSNISDNSLNINDLDCLLSSISKLISENNYSHDDFFNIECYFIDLLNRKLKNLYIADNQADVYWSYSDHIKEYLYDQSWEFELDHFSSELISFDIYMIYPEDYFNNLIELGA